MWLLIVLITCYFRSGYSYIDKQPDFVETCHIKEKNFEACSTKAVQRLFNKLPEGIPSIGLQPLDPLKVSVIKILQGAGPVNVNASLTNVTVRGFGHTHIVSNLVDPKDYDFYTKLHLPKLRIDGNYVLLGRILVIPLQGRGKCWFEAKDLDIHVKSDVDLYKKDGLNFYNLTGVHIKYKLGGLKMYMGNLFDGIKSLEESTNAYLNTNWNLVSDSLYPILVKTIEDIMLDILQRVFNNIPATFFVPDFD
ncbi:circadian clock-controlled protein-like [Photinus pyralis]|uniref:circadian clock-controlled protein-like n=1 Tax=Photinus pyralis TaxID=7054 RepID=UPI0012671592|nr:circadian clock-controlled protein-like [Photinus pyralis]